MQNILNMFLLLLIFLHSNVCKSLRTKSTWRTRTQGKLLRKKTSEVHGITLYSPDADQLLLTDWKAWSHLRAVMSHSLMLISPSPFPSAVSPVVRPTEHSVGIRRSEESSLLMSNTEDCCLCAVNNFSGIALRGAWAAKVE